jgi:hypothetical protein
MVITVAQESPSHHRPPAPASPSITAIPPKAISPRIPRDMPPVYTPSHPLGERSTKWRSSVPANRRFRNVIRIGPVQVATSYDDRGREKHTAACTAPRCGASHDYDSRAAAELAAHTHR